MSDDLILKLSTDLDYQRFDAKAGELEAYVTTFKNVDVVGDVIAPGALDKFIKRFTENKQTLPMLWSHKQDEPIGVWTEFKADSRGVIGKGEIFTDVTRGNDVRNLIKRGAVGSVSIGFRAKEYDNIEGGGRLFKEIELFETSVVLTPANPKALITQVKADDGSVNIKLVERLLRDAGLSRSESKSYSMKVFQDCVRLSMKQSQRTI